MRMLDQDRIELVPIADIKFARKNVRTSFDDEKLRELADSIKQRGVLQPIICRRSNGKPELIAGERRLRASKLVGLKTIPTIFRDSDDTEVTYDQIIENLQREDLSTDDQFRALKTLRDSGLSIERISKMIGLSTTTIQRVLVLDTLKPNIRKREDISAYAKAFIARAPEEVQNLLAERVASEEIGAKSLGHEVMPAIAETLEDDIFTLQEKRKVIEKIVRESSKDRPARSIVRQERGIKKLKSAGIETKISSNQALQEFIDFSDRYLDRLAILQSTRFEHLDPSLVIGLMNVFRQVHSTLEAILRDVEIARRRR